MRTREEVLQYALSFPNVYEERPFRDQSWQLVRVKGSKKTFLWIYERNGYVNLNVKVDPQWRDFWRSTYASVIAGSLCISSVYAICKYYGVYKRMCPCS